MRIRPATADDVPSVLPMVRCLCDLHARHDPDRFQVRADVLDRYAAWLPQRAADPRSVFLVAEQSNSAGSSPSALAAFLVGTVEPEVPIFWIPECGWIHDIWVNPDARRMGLARALTQEAVRRFSAIGVAQVRLHTGSFNDAARHVFASAGFRPCVVEMIHPLRSPEQTAPVRPA